MKKKAIIDDKNYYNLSNLDDEMDELSKIVDLMYDDTIDINKQVRLSVASDFWKSKSHLSDITERTFTKGKISSKDFLIKTDTKSFFDKGKHLINRYDNEVPVYYLPIIKITNTNVIKSLFCFHGVCSAKIVCGKPLHRNRVYGRPL